MMTLNEYQEKAMSTRMDSCHNALYMLFEIASEAGELQGKFAKAIRKKGITFDNNYFVGEMTPEQSEEWMTDVLHELGDVLWGVAGLADELGVSLDEVARMNIEKLASRKARGKIEGEGDNR